MLNKNWCRPLLVVLSVTIVSACNFAGNEDKGITAAKDNEVETSRPFAGPVVHVTSLNSVPLPSEQQARIKVDQYVSTLERMDIAFVGKQIPYTYSDGKITNSDGYHWWVSKHFALKTDLPQDKASLYLELLEMSYPHYVTLFGMEPPNIKRQRIAVVYGKSRESTRESMLDDGFRRGVHANAGGETMYYNRAGYSFPSHRQQHQRYIVIHETMHAFHMALNGHSTWAPNWITEGMADSVAHHVYDSDKHQLTVMVFDRAPMNYVETGLRQYAQGNQPSIAQINDDPALKRGLNFFIVHFLLSDPKRAQYFALFRDKLMSANPHSEATLPTANALLKETFPDWQAIETQFADYVKSVKSSFHIVTGPWEQDGNRYFIRSGKQKSMPRLDILLPENTSSRPHPVMDFPGPDQTSLITLNARDSAFSAGLLVEFVKEQALRGRVGLGLGLELHPDNQEKRKTFAEKSAPEKDSWLQLVIEQGKYLIVSGHNMESYRLGVALNDSLRHAIHTSLKLGVSARVKGNQLIIDLAAGNAKQSLSYSLTEQVRDKVIQGDLTLLAQNVGHKLTPYLPSDAHRVAGGLSEAWLAKDWQPVEGLFRTCETASIVLTDCESALENVFHNIQAGMNRVSVIESVQQLQASMLSQLKMAKKEQLAEALSGVTMTIEYHQSRPFVRIVNPGKYPVEVEFEKSAMWQLDGQPTGDRVFKAHSDNYLPVKVKPDVTELSVSANLTWQGISFALQDSNRVRPFDGVEMHTQVAKKQTNFEVSVDLTGPYSGLSEGVVRYEVYPTDTVVASIQELPVAFKPYETVSQVARFELLKGRNKEVRVRVVADLVVDGEDIQLQDEVGVTITFL